MRAELFDKIFPPEPDLTHFMQFGCPLNDGNKHEMVELTFSGEQKKFMCTYCGINLIFT